MASCLLGPKANCCYAPCTLLNKNINLRMRVYASEGGGTGTYTPLFHSGKVNKKQYEFCCICVMKFCFRLRRLLAPKPKEPNFSYQFLNYIEPFLTENQCKICAALANNWFRPLTIFQLWFLSAASHSHFLVVEYLFLVR